MHRILLLMILLSSIPASADRLEGIARYATDSLAIPGDNANKEQAAGYVFDITVQNERELDVILNRAERLRGQFSPADHGRIALVLHGEELRFFQKSNYSEFMQIVDKARLLDQNKLIDIKACQTSMQQYNIDPSELPDFIEQVPLAPVEIERLEREKGFTRL